MNLFLHGIEDFQIVNGDTLSAPAFVERGELKTFNVVVANPPYSISQWDRDAFSADKYGRNFLGVPNQSRADFAFIQHILMSMDKRNGRCAILLPHGVLNRMEDQGMRQGMVRADYVECIIGLGKNLFYNSPMEACILICRSTKNGSRTGRVLFVDARQFVTKSSKETFLTEEQIQKIASVYKDFVSIPELSYVATNDEIKDNNFSLAINMYVKHESEQEDLTSARSLAKQWMALSKDIHMRVDELTALVTKGAK
jgi:type I restriction enzyme M protein